MGHHIFVSGRSGAGGGEVVSVTGTANQITASPTTGDVVLTIPATFIAPGSIQAATTFNGLNGQTITGNSSGAWAIAANGTNQNITLTPSGTGIIQSGSATRPAGGSIILNLLNSQSAGATAIQLSTSSNGGVAIEGRSGGGVQFYRFSQALGSESYVAALQIAATGNLLLSNLTTDGIGVMQLPAGTTSAVGISFGADSWLFRTSSADMTISRTGLASTFFWANGSSQGFFSGAGSTGAGFYTTSSTTALIQTNNATAVTIDSSQNAAFTANIITSTSTKTGAGALSVLTTTSKYTTAGAADALTLADGSNGQIKVVILDVLTTGGDSAVLTPTTKTGYTTITFSAAGQSATLQFVTTRGWVILSLRGAIAA